MGAHFVCNVHPDILGMSRVGLRRSGLDDERIICQTSSRAFRRTEEPQEKAHAFLDRMPILLFVVRWGLSTLQSPLCFEVQRDQALLYNTPQHSRNVWTTQKVFS